MPVKPILGDFYFTKYLNHSGFGIRNTATYNTRSTITSQMTVSFINLFVDSTDARDKV